jgi:ApbE superfamily uncharacterized protein (UPF0280 family)
MGEGRFEPLTIKEGESDLWIGLPPGSPKSDIGEFSRRTLASLRALIRGRIAAQAEFGTSLEALPPDPCAPPVIRSMLEAAIAAEVGPMASVAGAIADSLGRAVAKEFSLREIAVENGGDIYLALAESISLSIYAGLSSLSNKVGVDIPSGLSPLGVCTSSGTVGPSLSFGKADACLVACRDCALADAYATRFGNMVRSFADIGPTLESAKGSPGLISLVIIRADRVGAVGGLRLRPFA